MSGQRRAHSDRRTATSPRKVHVAREHSAVEGDVRALLQALDAARAKANLTKAALAGRVGFPPETIRRLFTAEAQNPTATTLVRLAHALGFRIALVRSRKGTSATR